jgi:hypothetical protein
LPVFLAVVDAAIVVALSPKLPQAVLAEGGGVRRKRFAVRVTWLNGETEFLHPGVRPRGVATFASRFEAAEMADFLLQGVEFEVQSIDVVPAPQIGARA